MHNDIDTGLVQLIVLTALPFFVAAVQAGGNYMPLINRKYACRADLVPFDWHEVIAALAPGRSLPTPRWATILSSSTAPAKPLRPRNRSTGFTARQITCSRSIPKAGTDSRRKCANRPTLSWSNTLRNRTQAITHTTMPGRH